ncbi:MAG: tape measure protein, partial [Caulobacter sp.]
MAAPIVTEIEVRTKAAEQSLAAFREAMAKAGGSSEKVNQVLNEQNQTFLKLTSTTDNLARARLQYEANERRAMAALNAGKISVEQYSAAVQGQIDKLSALIAKQNQVGRGSGFQNVSREADQANDSASSLLGTFGRFAGAAAAVYGVYTAFSSVKTAVAEAGDAVAMQTAKVKLATETLIGGGQAFSEVTRIANTLGAPLEATAGLFARIGRSAAEAGVTTTKEVARAVETVQKLAIASGASSAEAAAGSLQLGQALASGRLQGDELRSILENMPPIARAIAKEFGVGVGQLRDMGAAGELVSDRVLKGILSASEDADRQFAAMPKTVERASQSMANSWTLFLAQLDKSLGVSKSIIAAMETGQSIADRATKGLAGPTPEERLAALNREIANPKSPDGSRTVESGGFGRTLARNEGPSYNSSDQQMAALQKQKRDLEDLIERSAIAADRDETRRASAQMKLLQDRLDGLERERAAELTKAEYKSKLSKQAIEEIAAYDKAYSESRVKTVGMDKAIQEEQAKRAGEQAVALLRLKQSAEDRWKADTDAAQKAGKAADDLARSNERNARESLKAAKDEQDARDRALESVEQQIYKLEEETAAIGMGARQRAITNEVLKAEAALKKGLVNLNQDLYDSEIKRVEAAAGAKYDAEEATRNQQKLADEAARYAERVAEEAERPMRNLFDNLQRGTAQIFEGLLSGTLRAGDALRQLLLKAAAEYISAVTITPVFRSLGNAVGLGSGPGGASSGGGFSMPSLGGGGFGSSITNSINDWGARNLGTAANAATSVPSAVGGWTVTGTGGPSASALSQGTTLTQYAGAGLGVASSVYQLATAKSAGGAIGGASSIASGLMLLNPATAPFAPLVALGGNMLGGLLGGKKPSVGPGGGIGFGAGADGKIQIGFTSQDNGYDPVAKNSDAAQSVVDGAINFFKQIGGTFKGTAVSGRGGELGYDAGLKKYTGGDDTSNGRGRFDTLEQAMAASLVAVVKNSIVDGVSKDIQDRIRAVNTSQDMENLLQYIAGLNQIYDSFEGWAPPLTAAEQAMQQLNAAFDQAKSAAESLSKSTDDLKTSFEKQKAYLISEFNAPLIERELRAKGKGLDADLLAFDRAAADTRKQAAALGGEAVVQAEKTLVAERLRIMLGYMDQAKSAEQQAQEARLAPLRQTYESLVSELQNLRNVWAGIAEQMIKFRDSLKIGALSTLSPEQQMREAQR